ncbi:O-antigen ligase family protein [Pontibacter oryzae]|uniref:O-antigen ligase family protein n=2 Tax=Pontibacter oryzae TaxID=2304593 RepID=A0A399RW01_9BACT|nr:O-antigen ligase family protein [Pontibacter oryzae]
MTPQEKKLYILISLFFFTLLVSWLRVANVVITAGITIYSYVAFPMSEKLSLLKKRKGVQAMIFFSVLILVSFALSYNLSQGINYLTLRLPLVIFPVSLGLLQLSATFKEKALLTFAYITTLVCVLCFGYALYNYFILGRADAMYNDNLTLLIGHQSVYVALLVNFAIYIFLYLLLFRKVSFRAGVFCSILFLTGISYLLGSRINLAILLVMCVGISIYYILNKKLFVHGVALFIALVVGAFIVFKAEPLMLNRYKELAYSKFEYDHIGTESHYFMELTPDQWNGTNFRLAAWNCGWELFKENPLIGVGLGDKKEELIQKYKQKDFYFAIETNKNVHNNYLDILYSMGLIGFAFFLLAWVIFPLIEAVKYHDILALMMLITLALAWVTEIYFDRSVGGMISGFFVVFLLTDKKNAEV